VKSCSGCKTDKPHAEFGRDPRKKTGLSYWCKACQYAATTASEHRRINRFRDHNAAWTYIVYAADGACLYVGQTNRPDRRIRNHKQKTPWWHDADRIVWQQFIDPEQVLISELKPIHNKQLVRK
jgi:hypothetical protein